MRTTSEQALLRRDAPDRTDHERRLKAAELEATRAAAEWTRQRTELLSVAYLPCALVQARCDDVARCVDRLPIDRQTADKLLRMIRGIGKARSIEEARRDRTTVPDDALNCAASGGFRRPRAEELVELVNLTGAPNAVELPGSWGAVLGQPKIARTRRRRQTTSATATNGTTGTGTPADERRQTKRRTA